VLFLLPLIFASLFSLSQQGAIDEATGAKALTVDVFVVNEDDGIFPMNSTDPAFMSGGVLGTIGTWIPHMHAAEGFRLVMTGEGTVETVLIQVAWLLGFAAVFFVLASRRLRFT